MIFAFKWIIQGVFRYCAGTVCSISIPPAKITLIFSLYSTTIHSSTCRTSRSSYSMGWFSSPSRIVKISSSRDLVFSFFCCALPYWASCCSRIFFSFISSVARCSSKSSTVSVAMDSTVHCWSHSLLCCDTTSSDHTGEGLSPSHLERQKSNRYNGKKRRKIRWETKKA